MNKKTIITALLAIVALAGQAKKTIVWENPSVAYSAIPYFQIQKVEMTKEKTAMYVRMLPNQRKQLSGNKWETLWHRWKRQHTFRRRLHCFG